MNKVEAMVRGVLNRPSMYTINGSYGEVVAFLTGYYSGAALGRPNEPSVSIWSDFSQFVGASLDTTSAPVFVVFQQIHGPASLKALVAKYEEFEIAREKSESEAMYHPPA